MSFEYENYESFTQYVTRELKENYIFQVPDADTLKELNNNDFWYEVTHGVSEKDKSMAKSRSHYYKKAQQRIAERENDDAGYQMEMAWHSHTTGGVEM